jgi:hypothetical protein
MSDVVDDANELAEQQRAAALRRQRSSARFIVGATGACLSCGATVGAGRRWCDADCRDEWEANR